MVKSNLNAIRFTDSLPAVDANLIDYPVCAYVDKLENGPTITGNYSEPFLEVFVREKMHELPAKKFFQRVTFIKDDNSEIKVYGRGFTPGLGFSDWIEL